MAFMMVVNDGLEVAGEVGEMGDIGVAGVVGEIGVAGTSVSWSLVSVAAVPDEETEASLLLREDGCKAAATAAI